MNKKIVSFVLIFLTASLAYPIASSLAVSLPNASNDTYILNENKILDISGSGVLANDTAAAGKTLTAGLISNVKNGTLILNSNGSFIYIPDVNFYGTDGFKYVANDGTVSSNIANVTITVNAVNHVPVARNDVFFVNENSTLSIMGHGVLVNDTDADGNTLTASLVTNVLNGILTLNQNGSFIYTPNPNFHGVDTFTYKTNDGTTFSNIASVTITVNQFNTNPPPTNDPILQLLSKIHDVLVKITGLENDMNALEDKNKALELRIVHLESLVQNNQPNPLTASGNNNQQGEQENEHDNEHNNSNNHDD